MVRANVENVDAIMEALRPALEADVARVRESLRSDVKCSALCPAERNVLRLMGLGLTNAAIAKYLCIGTTTVRAYSKRLHDKCGIQGRNRLAVLASKVEA